MLKTNSSNSPAETSSSLSLRRKFGSEMTVQINNHEGRLMGSFQLNKDSSKDQTGIHTKMSNAMSQYSIINLKLMSEERLMSNRSNKSKTSIKGEEDIEQYSPSSSSSSSNSQSS